jgi:hypothetical protein
MYSSWIVKVLDLFIFLRITLFECVWDATVALGASLMYMGKSSLFSLAFFLLLYVPSVCFILLYCAIYSIGFSFTRILFWSWLDAIHVLWWKSNPLKELCMF